MIGVAAGPGVAELPRRNRGFEDRTERTDACACLWRGFFGWDSFSGRTGASIIIKFNFATGGGGLIVNGVEVSSGFAGGCGALR
jgi:hypothetical protein